MGIPGLRFYRQRLMLSVLNLSKPMLLAVVGTFLVAACRNGSTGKSDTCSSASQYPKFARACIRKVEGQRWPDRASLAVTTFVGATPSSAPFVAISEPQSTLAVYDSSMRGGNTFFAHPLSSLYITTPEYTVELTSVVPFRSLRSTKVIVGDKGLITLDLDLMEVVIGKSETGDWKALSVHCKFPKMKVSDEELQSDFRRLEKMGWGDKKFPPEHAQLDDHGLQGGLAGELAEQFVIVALGHGGDAEVRQRHQLLRLQQEDVEGGLVLLLVHRPEEGRDHDLLGPHAQEDRQVAELVHGDLQDRLGAFQHAGGPLLRRMRLRSDFPTMSSSITAINQLMASEDTTAARLAAEILKDFALTNKILRLVNSAQYGQYSTTRISTISRAISSSAISRSSADR